MSFSLLGLELHPTSPMAVIEVRLNGAALWTAGSGPRVGRGAFDFPCVLVASFGVERPWYAAGVCVLDMG